MILVDLRAHQLKYTRTEFWIRVACWTILIRKLRGQAELAKAMLSLPATKAFESLGLGPRPCAVKSACAPSCALSLSLEASKTEFKIFQGLNLGGHQRGQGARSRVSVVGSGWRTPLSPTFLKGLGSNLACFAVFRCLTFYPLSIILDLQ